MYGLYNDDVKRTCSPITDTMCVKYKKKKNYCCFGLVKAVLLQFECNPTVASKVKAFLSRYSRKANQTSSSLSSDSIATTM